jgi:hypothetical protein
VGTTSSVGRSGGAADRGPRLRRPPAPGRAGVGARAGGVGGGGGPGPPPPQGRPPPPRTGLEREAQLLRDQLARKAEGADAREKAAFLELAAENRRLRTEVESCRRSAAEAEELGRRLAASLAELGQARRELQQLEDERQRERAEHEAEVGALRSELARESLRRQVATDSGLPPAEAPASAIEADERIRAFRQHLKELHEKEAARRAERSIASRLSRLWKHTGPG